MGLSLPCSLPNFKKWEILKSGKITLISWKMPLLRSGEEVEGGGQREKKKGRREPGPALGSPSLLFLGPDVNRQAEEGCASGSLSNAVSYGHIQSVPNSRGCYHCLAPGSPASSSASPPPPRPRRPSCPLPRALHGFILLCSPRVSGPEVPVPGSAIGHCCERVSPEVMPCSHQGCAG